MNLLERKKYSFFDFFRMTYSVVPLYCVITIISKCMNALVPSFQLLMVASLIDTTIQIFNGNKPYSDIFLPLMIFILISIYTYLNSTFLELFNSKQRMKFNTIVSCEIIKKRGSLEYQYIENKDSWEIITRSCNNAPDQFLLGFNSLMNLIALSIRIISIIIIIWVHVWWSAMIVIAIGIPLIVLAYKSGQNSYEAFKNAHEYELKSNYLERVLTTRAFIEERTLFQYASQINDKWLKTNNIAREIKLKVERQNFLRMKGASIFTAILSFVIIGSLLIPLSKELITVGIFISLSNQIQHIIHTMSWYLTDLIEDMTQSKEYLEDFTEFINLTDVKDILLPLENKHMEINTIEFKNVSFRYPGTEVDILKNLSFQLTKGRVYAFVGANGAGKTTIIKLLTGLYDNYRGEIFINGTNLRDFTSHELRSLYTIIYQDFAKYQISLREILQLGSNRIISDKEMLKALSLAGFTTINNEQELNLELNLGKIKPDAIDISGGQWQKIAIAHAILMHGPILILDEPTASLDPIAESALYTDFKNIVKRDINILITHRLGAAKIADEIILLDNGQISERGTHEQLIQCDGLYRKMFDSQKEWYI